MKKLVTAAGVFGPYNAIEVLVDRYRVDGPSDLPFTVVGTGQISDVVDGDFPAQSSVVEVQPAPMPTKEQLLAQLQALQAQIQALE